MRKPIGGSTNSIARDGRSEDREQLRLRLEDPIVPERSRFGGWIDNVNATAGFERSCANRMLDGWSDPPEIASSVWTRGGAILTSMSDASTVTVHIPAPLRACAGASELALSAKSLRAMLEELERHHPDLHRSICDETGTVRRHINLFVNTNHMRDCKGLDTPLGPGDVVMILPAVSGG